MCELRVLLAGGGSGGSVTPVLAVAQALRTMVPEVKLLFVGTRDGPEAALAAAENIPFAAVDSGKLRRYWDVQNFTDPWRVARGTHQARALVDQFRPHVALAAGGFGAVPPMVAARMAGAQTLIHQQDVIPGLANRLLVPWARRITLTMPSSLAHFPRGRSVVTGNPVRAAIFQANPRRAYAALGLEEGVPLLLITGGGTGALTLNRLVALGAPELVKTFQVVHLTGRGRGVPVQTASPRYRAVEFLVDDMPDVLAAADIVVTRAGMGTLSELAALEKPAVVVPMPGSHQDANAQAFARLDAVEVLTQDVLTPEMLVDRLLVLFHDPERRRGMGQAIGASMPRDAAQRVAAEVVALARATGQPREPRP